MNFIQNINHNLYILIPVIIIWIVAVLIWTIEMYLKVKERKSFNKKLYKNSIIIIITIGIIAGFAGLTN